MKAYRAPLSLALAATIAGCTLAPTYHRPPSPVSASYTAPTALTQGGGKPETTRAIDLGWRDFFVDPRLQALIDLSLKNNRDLRTAMLNVEKARAQFKLQNADLFPHIGLTGSALYESLPNGGFLGSSGSSLTGGSSGGSATSTVSVGQGGNMFRYYTAGIGVSSYELDVFGRLRSLSRQAFELYLAQSETRRSTQITLISQVASDYLQWSADEALLKLTRDTLTSQEDSLKITKAQFDAGSTNLLSLRQAETQVEQARANLAQYERQVAQDINAIELLIGAPMPDNLPPPLPLGQQTVMADLPAGLPSDLLANRPDIVSAEHTLIADNANIGAARAAFFPQILLTAQDGVQSLQLSHLFTAGATSWSFAPQVTVPIFTGGQNEANLDLAKIQKRLSIAAYEKTIQTAFREVSDSLVARGTYLDQVRQQQSLVDTQADAYRLAMMRFRSGVDAYLVPLDSQRLLYGDQQALISLRLAQLQNLVTIYRVLGGGWREHTASASAPSAEKQPR